MNLSQWTDRGADAARTDLRAGHTGRWDQSAVLTHLGLADEDDADAMAYGLRGEDLAAAQQAVLAGYERGMTDVVDILLSMPAPGDLERHGRRHLHSMPARAASRAAGLYAWRLEEISGHPASVCEALVAQWMREGIRSPFEVAAEPRERG